MADVGSSASIAQLSGPAAAAASYAKLEKHVTEIVRMAITKQDVRGDIATEIADMHNRTARLLDQIVRDHGTDTMEVAAEYAATALEAGLIYTGQELDQFLHRISGAVRSTTRQLLKAGGGSISE
jgi:hypothetical protein